MKLDLQDALLLLGISCIVGGVGCWSRPAAAIVFGVFCMMAVVLIGRRRSAEKQTKGDV